MKKINLKEAEKIQIVKNTIKFLRNKKQLKEASEPELNNNIKLLQTCVQELQSAKDYVDILKSSSFDQEEQNMLEFVIDKINFINTQLNTLIQKDTSEPITEDLEMTMDQIMKDPDEIAKLKDKKIDVKVTDPNNTSSTSSATM